MMEVLVDAANFALLAAGVVAVSAGNGLIGFGLITMAVLLWADMTDIETEEDEPSTEEKDLKRRYQFYDDDQAM